ncbi:Cycloeucalenol cycloisomerase (Cycloeucalenol--obtusifoliol isomerase) (Cyclopropyl sterol isomerase) [Durusdinium trenchii]|uniref:Cycloeucalenol cycloisomerase (Cycloeucalenol--obtusifoliol isomerase) (Cyclopropyl sterol isomerase) n=1 Tax=Durusdinium trenchii TaxID=1381693 RepID=A0ABP0Q6V0_9DINO
MFDAMDVRSMLPILTSLLCGLGGISLFLEPEERSPPKERSPKECCENWFLLYGMMWMSCFAVIVGFRIYESMDKWAYLGVCGGLAAPLLLQPLLLPALTKEASVPLAQRFCTKANLWIAVYSFLGNYWGTHYFYCVLKAKYTLPFLPSHQLNGVPVCMYLATHFYFSFYHALGNKALRWISTRFRPSFWRKIFSVVFVCVMSYSVAFMETFSISAFPYYTFENRGMAYTLGSAFYAIYLVVSFPLFARLDERPGGHGCFDAALDALGAWAAVHICLDLVRLCLGVELHIA